MKVLVWHMPEWNDENQGGSQSMSWPKSGLGISWLQVYSISPQKPPRCSHGKIACTVMVSAEID
jgi:hypothetical protein